MRRMSLVIILLCLSCVINASEFMFKHLEVKDGLSNNQVLDIYKDSEGFMWFATASGLNRYDGCQVTVFRSYDTDSASLPDNYIKSIQEDNKGNLWILTGAGYAIYNPESEKFNRDVRVWLWEVGVDGTPALVYIDHNKNMWFYVEGKGCYLYMPESELLYPLLFDARQLPEGDITDIAECKDGILLVYSTGRLVCLDIRTNKIKWQREDLAKELVTGKQDVFTLFVDRDEDIWIYSQSGMWIYNPKQKKWRPYPENGIKGRSYNRVRAVAQDKQGRIWIGKERDGIDILDKETGEVTVLKNSPDDERSLQNNTVMALYEDSNEMMWIGTYKKGVSYFNESIFKFGIEPIGDINCIEEDKEGSVWLGTSEAGILYWNSLTGSLSAFPQKNATEPVADAIACILKAGDGKLWIGTLGEGLLCYDKGLVTHYKNIPGRQNSLAHNNVQSLTEDKKGNIWIGMQGGGVQSLDVGTGLFTAYNVNSADLISDYVSSLCMGKEGSLWIGTAQGLSELNIETKKVTNLTGTKSGKEHFSNQNINQVYEDSRGLVWIGTREGLNVYNPKMDELTLLDVEQEVSSPIISGIVEDDNRNIWVTTVRGVANIIPTADSKTGHYIFCNYTYDDKDGLQNCGFNQRSIKKLSSGEILMGGLYGINRFRPDDIKYNKILPKVVFTQFLLFDDEVKVGKEYGGRIILDKALNKTGQVELSYEQNVFSIQFASDNYILPEKMKYAYKLEGFNERWLTATYGKVTYTNLDPGTYVLKVKAINSDGYSGDEEASLKIVIHSPFWLSIWAYIIYGLLAVAALVLAHRLVVRREWNKFKMRQVEQETGKHQGIADVNDDLMKDREILENEVIGADIDVSGNEAGMAHEVPVFHPEPESEAKPEEEPNHIITIEGLEEDIRKLESGDVGKATEEEKVDAVLIVAPQRATVIQLTEGENDEIMAHIIPPEELPEVETTVPGKKKRFTPVPLAAKGLAGEKEAVRNLSHIGSGSAEVTLTSMDEKLIDHAVKYVEDNIARSDLSVEELSRELGMSRVHLYKKLLAITGKTPIEFIRVIRLEQAARLLCESRQNISEIAYQVGFNNPKYFSKYFKEEFGVLPSAYQGNESK